jgi:hypothetical protein
LPRDRVDPVLPNLKRDRLYQAALDEPTDAPVERSKTVRNVGGLCKLKQLIAGNEAAVSYPFKQRKVFGGLQNDFVRAALSANRFRR